MIEVSKKYLPKMAASFSSPKLNLHIGDGFEFMKQHKGEYDVIITDSSDPTGISSQCFTVLQIRQGKRDNLGIIVRNIPLKRML